MGIKRRQSWAFATFFPFRYSLIRYFNVAIRYRYSATFKKFAIRYLLYTIRVHRPFSERPFLERPFSERPISERPSSEGDHSPNDHSPKATILRTTNIRKRPILGRLIIAEATMGAIFAIAKNREKFMTQQTLDNILFQNFTHSPGFSLSAAPDFSSLPQATCIGT
jgi:hypothetical protein